MPLALGNKHGPRGDGLLSQWTTLAIEATLVSLYALHGSFLDAHCLTPSPSPEKIQREKGKINPLTVAGSNRKILEVG